MHLDYRCYIKFRDSDLWREKLEAISMEASDGEEYTLLEISKVFNSPRGMMRMMEPIGDVFDTVTAVENEAFCFIHDHRKSADFFVGLTEYIFGEIVNTAPDDFVMIVDITDYDTDMMGDHIFYYLGGNHQELKKCVVEGPEGLEHHDIEISNFAEMLKYETLTDAQKEKLQELTQGTYPTDLMDPLRMADIFTEGNEQDMTQEIEFSRACLEKYSDEELLKLCLSQEFLNEGEVEVIIDGKPDRNRIAEAYVEILMQDCGLSITDYAGPYDGDIELFKEYAVADIDEMVKQAIQ